MTVNDREQSGRARVFISCGQSKLSDERETARNIARKLEGMGFDPYIAVEEQTLRGLRENVFAQLDHSEYFLFVDFKREQLVGEVPPFHRGSLFSHQELAVASYLDIPVLAFQETGVKPEDGLLRFLQTNATPFTDRHLLPDVVAEQVRQRGWNPRLRNELVLERAPEQYIDARVAQSGEIRRFFHVTVRNLHNRKTATNCYVYLERALRLNPPTEIRLQSVELKWAGYILPNAHIAPHSDRRFDAFFISHSRPTGLGFNTFSDSTEFILRIEGPGNYELGYLVVADNFPVASMSVILHLGSTIGSTTLVAKTGEPNV